MLHKNMKFESNNIEMIRDATELLWDAYKGEFVNAYQRFKWGVDENGRFMMSYTHPKSPDSEIQFTFAGDGIVYMVHVRQGRGPIMEWTYDSHSDPSIRKEFTDVMHMLLD